MHDATHAATPVRATRADLRRERVRVNMNTLAVFATAALLAATVGVVLLSALVRPQAPQPGDWTAVTIGPSSSLWSLASAHPVEGLTTAETVDLIRSENALTSSTLYVGQTVRVPSTVGDSAAALAQR